MIPLPTVALSVGTAISATLAIIGRQLQERRLLHLIFKPTTTILILILAIAAPAQPGSSYVTLVAVGLVFSLIGDVALMLPPEYFLVGVGSFAVTHALYLIAFVGIAGLAVITPATLLVAAVAGLLAQSLWGGISASLKIPVAIYILLISSMLAQALGAAIGEANPTLILAAVGASLFFISDGFLAIDRFRAPFRGSGVVVLSTYWVGQWLIAMSIWPEQLGFG
jgi:uncharacterized membrane protein YhhN